MPDVVAAVRAGAVNFPLFLHVLGAMLLVGSLLAVATATSLAWRRRDSAVALTRFGLRTVLLGVLPAYVLMWIGAQWTESREHLGGADLTWLDIGYITADIGALLILVSIVLSAIGLRKLREGRALWAGQAVAVISLVLLVAYLVTVWAMSTKPA